MVRKTEALVIIQGLIEDVKDSKSIIAQSKLNLFNTYIVLYCGPENWFSVRLLRFGFRDDEVETTYRPFSEQSAIQRNNIESLLKEVFVYVDNRGVYKPGGNDIFSKSTIFELLKYAWWLVAFGFVVGVIVGVIAERFKFLPLIK